MKKDAEILWQKSEIERLKKQVANQEVSIGYSLAVSESFESMSIYAHNHTLCGDLYSVGF